VAGQNVIEHLPVEKPADPVRDGYRFAGWYVGVDCSKMGWWIYNDETEEYVFQLDPPADPDNYDGWEDYGCLEGATDTAWDFAWLVPEDIYNLPEFEYGVPSDWGLPYIMRLSAKWTPACQWNNALDPDDPMCVEPVNPTEPTEPVVPGVPNTGFRPSL
jgi:hypothetical protein